jgi:ribonuclease HII
MLAGLDEAGRGALAGPVMAGAVVLPGPAGIDIAAARRLLPGLDDSKRLTPRARERLAELIRTKAVAWAVAEATLAEIEQHNILHAALLAMRRALEGLAPPPDGLVVDGPHLPPRLAGLPARAVVDGDALLPCIMAAGILAKTARDSVLHSLDAQYPGYGFAAHKGYSAPQHLAALERLGPCPVHRRTFAPVARLLAPGLFGDTAC